MDCNKEIDENDELLKNSSNLNMSLSENGHSPDLIEYSDLRSFEIGEIIPSDIYKQDNLLFLNNGKIRILKGSDSGEKSTLMLLNAGDIWDIQKYEGLTYIASTRVEISFIPTTHVMQNHALNTRYNQISNQIKQTLDICNKKCEESFQPTETADEILIAKEESSEKPSLNNVVISLQGLLAYYDYPKEALKITDGEINDFNQLEKKVKILGFKAQRNALTWPDLLNASYPLLLEDDKNTVHWIVGRKGNSLLEEKEGSHQRFIPNQDVWQNKFNVLKIQKIGIKQKLRTFEPFSMSWYLKLFMQNYTLTVQMILSSVLVQVFALGMPIFYMIIFDRVFGRQNLSTLDVIAVGMVLIFLFDLAIKSVRSYVLSHLLEYVDKFSIEIFLQQVFNISFAKMSREDFKSYVEKFAEIFKTNQAIIYTLLISSLDAAFSLLVIVVLMMLHLQLALIAAAPIVPIAIITFWKTPIQKNKTIQSAQSQKQSQIRLSEIVENNETIRSVNASRSLFQDTFDRVKEHIEKDFLSRFDKISMGTDIGFIMNLGSFAILYFGAHEVLEGKISFGIYLAISMMGRNFIGGIQKLITSLQQFYEARGTTQLLKAMFNEENGIGKGSNKVILTNVTGHIKFVDVCFRYQPELPLVLNNINLDIKPGQKIILTGKSGAGKTTMLRLLQRLWEPISGYIALDSVNIADIDEINLRDNIGVALQKPGIFSGTIRNNIALANPYASAEEILRAASFVHLDELLLKIPKGMDAITLPMGANFSGGQAAQIALARVILMDPQILVLDEALNPLDPALQETIICQIFEKYNKSTCIFVTDSIPIHKKADNIFVLQEGQIVEQGSFDELLEANGYYYHLFAKAGV